MAGNEGADVFVYKYTGDSSTQAGKWDVITDFNPAEGDRIDLRQIDASSKFAGDQAFKFGSGGGGEGAIWTERVGEDLLITGNIENSRSGPDFVIELDHYSGSVSAGDFYL